MFRHRLVLMLLALVIVAVATTACRMPPLRFPATVPPATPSNIVLPSATPVLISSPTPSPSPTPLPGDMVDSGQRSLRNGDWAAAATSFQQVINDSFASEDQQVGAYLGQAQALLKAGDFASSEAALDSLLARYPANQRIAQAHFLRGETRLGLSNWGSAIEDYDTYLSLRPGLIDSYVYERIGDAYFELGMDVQGVDAYNQALAADRPVLSQLVLREKFAQILRNLGRYDEAIAQYQTILSVAELPGYRATIDTRIAATYFEAGNTDAYYEHLGYVFMTYPDSSEALDALRALLQAEIPVDQYQRGVVNFNQEQYDIALEAFYNYLAATPIANYRPEAYLYIGRSYRHLGNPQSALMELRAMLNRFDPEDGDAWGDAWLEVADIYAEMGDVTAAYAAYDRLVADHPTLSQAPTALYNAALLAEAHGDSGTAITYLDRLAAEYPADPRAAEGMFRLGIQFFRTGDYATAVTMFTKASEQPANERPAAAQFWLGRTDQSLGQSDEATIALNNASSLEPDSYYGLRAQDILSSERPFAPLDDFTVPDADAGRTEAEQWLIQIFGLSQTPPLAAALRDDIATSPLLLRGKELWDLGLRVEARDSFEAVRRTYQDDPLALYQLAIYFRDLGLYRSSLLSAARLITLAGTTPLEVPTFLGRLRYPVYYDDLILAYSDEYDLDPLWVYSLIWQESQFEGFAVSSASAQGLMQIWPPTGEDIAARLEWPGYQPSDLQRPVVNVAFGAWLLRDELDRFGGDQYAALTAYNAGPGRTADWVQASQGDPDLFVEAITLQEPRTYIQRIIEHYAFYHALYSSP